jgi:hypothetical protein
MLGSKKWTKWLKTASNGKNSRTWCKIKHQKSASALFGGFITNP